MPRQGAAGALDKETDRQIAAFQQRVGRIDAQGHFISIEFLPGRDDHVRFAAEQHRLGFAREKVAPLDCRRGFQGDGAVAERVGEPQPESVTNLLPVGNKMPS